MDGVSAEADGNFDVEWSTTGTEYAVTIDARASGDLNRLRLVVDEVAEVPMGSVPVLQ